MVYEAVVCDIEATGRMQSVLLLNSEASASRLLACGRGLVACPRASIVCKGATLPCEVSNFQRSSKSGETHTHNLTSTRGCSGRRYTTLIVMVTQGTRVHL